MKFPPLVRGVLVRRYKRFLADVRVDGRTLTVHCPNTGSLLGCCEPGSPVWLRDDAKPTRKYPFTWVLVRAGGASGRALVCVDTSLPNRLAAEAIQAGRVPGLEGARLTRPEPAYVEGGRADLLLEDTAGSAVWVEVKSTTLARGRTALFPDAVTERGLRHLTRLAERVAAGDRAVQLFWVQRADCRTFAPAADIDPAYAEGLRTAAAAGVEVVALSGRIRTTGITAGQPLTLDPSCGSLASR